MIIRQEESTPIGDYFHDNGILKIFQRIEDNVDEFEVNTTSLMSHCDALIEKLKGAKSQIKKVESYWEEQERQKEITDSINSYN